MTITGQNATIRYAQWCALNVKSIGDIMDIHAIIKMVAEILIIVGALNWGLVGLLGLDLVSKLFGAGSVITRVVFILVGLAGLNALLVMLKLM